MAQRILGIFLAGPAHWTSAQGCATVQRGAQCALTKGDSDVKHKLMVAGGIALVVLVVLFAQKRGYLAKIPFVGQYL